MVFAVIYAEDAQIVGTYESVEEATERLAQVVASKPTLQDEIGIRAYEHGRPAGDWHPASEILAGEITQPQLAAQARAAALH